MEKLYYNLSEEQFSKGGKILLWGFATLFFMAGVFVLIVSLGLGKKSIPAVLSAAPFGISIVVSVIASFATIKRKNLFFLVDDEKIDFRDGIFKPHQHTFNWNEVTELVMPSKQKKAKVLMKDGSAYVINLTWIQKKKGSLIRKHIYLTAKEKNIKITKVRNLSN
jgi:hypothetical protein